MPNSKPTFASHLFYESCSHTQLSCCCDLLMKSLVSGAFFFLPYLLCTHKHTYLIGSYVLWGVTFQCLLYYHSDKGYHICIFMHVLLVTKISLVWNLCTYNICRDLGIELLATFRCTSIQFGKQKFQPSNNLFQPIRVKLWSRDYKVNGRSEFSLYDRTQVW